MLRGLQPALSGIYVSVTTGNSRDVARSSTTAPKWPCSRTSIPIRRCWRSASPPPRRDLRPPRAPFWSRAIRIAELATAADPAGAGLDHAPRARAALEKAGGTAGRWRSAARAIRFAVARGIGIGAVSEAEFVPDASARVPVSDAEIYTYARVVCLREQNARLVRASRWRRSASAAGQGQAARGLRR
jgi:hypothetical protein